MDVFFFDAGCCCLVAVDLVLVTIAFCKGGCGVDDVMGCWRRGEEREEEGEGVLHWWLHGVMFVHSLHGLHRVGEGLGLHVELLVMCQLTLEGKIRVVEGVRIQALRKLLGGWADVSLGANHCRLRHCGWEQCGHDLTARARGHSDPQALGVSGWCDLGGDVWYSRSPTLSHSVCPKVCLPELWRAVFGLVGVLQLL